MNGRMDCVLRDLIQVKEDLLPKTDLNYALVRRKNDDGTIKVLSFSPLKVLKSLMLQITCYLKNRTRYIFSLWMNLETPC